MGIDNTTRRMQEDSAEKMAFLAEGYVTGDADTFIAGQERAGQAQFVNSDRLPTDRGDDQPWLDLGFTFGEPDPDDPMFCPATLPPGWTRKGSDHAMWSHLLDEHGRQRVAIFYKAAFYDRKAHMRIVSLDWYVTCHIEHDGPLILDDKWATSAAVLDAMRGEVAENRREAGEFRGYAAAEDRDEKNRAGCAEIARDREATAVKYEAAIAALEAKGNAGA
jgi:hypothetical protein